MTDEQKEKLHRSVRVKREREESEVRENKFGKKLKYCMWVYVDCAWYLAKSTEHYQLRGQSNLEDPKDSLEVKKKKLIQ